MGIIVVTGIPGVGKTTVMKKAAEGIDIKFVTFGTVMIDIAKEIGFVRDRDEMRKLSLDQQKELQMKTAERVSKMGNVIVDTHCSIKTTKGYMPGLPEWVVKKLKPDNIILVEADPEEIFNRRINDDSRNRDSDSVDIIKEHQHMNRAIAMAYSAITGATVKIIQNHNDKIEQAIEDVKPILE
jgi:adenylate kinase